MLPIISTEKEFEILRSSVCKIALKVMRNKKYNNWLYGLENT